MNSNFDCGRHYFFVEGELGERGRCTHMGQMSLKATFLYYYSHTPASPVPICPFGWRWYL